MAQRTGLTEEGFMAEPPWPMNLLIPQSEEARTIPLGTGDGKSDFGEAVIGLAIPGKTVGHHHYPLRAPLPLPHQDCSGRQFGPLLVEADQPRRHCRTGFLRTGTIQQLPRLMVEIPQAIGLNPIGDDRKQQMTRQMIGRWSLQDALPPRAQTFEIETAQMRDLILNRYLGRDTTLATLIPHRIRPPASRDRQPRTKPCYP